MIEEQTIQMYDKDITDILLQNIHVLVKTNN